jgi:hypothetical protein
MLNTERGEIYRQTRGEITGWEIFRDRRGEKFRYLQAINLE